MPYATTIHHPPTLAIQKRTRKVMHMLHLHMARTIFGQNPIRNIRSDFQRLEQHRVIGWSRNIFFRYQTILLITRLQLHLRPQPQNDPNTWQLYKQPSEINKIKIIVTQHEKTWWVIEVDGKNRQTKISHKVVHFIRLQTSDHGVPRSRTAASAGDSTLHWDKDIYQHSINGFLILKMWAMLILNPPNLKLRWLPRRTHQQQNESKVTLIYTLDILYALYISGHAVVLTVHSDCTKTSGTTLKYFFFRTVQTVRDNTELRDKSYCIYCP